MALAGPAGRAGQRGGLVGEGRGEVALGEAAREPGLAERAVDDGVTVQPGQLDRFAHLGPDPGGAGRGRFGQPQRRTVAQPKERRLASRFRSRDAVERAGRGRREVRVIDPRAAGGGDLVAGDLDRPAHPDVHYHDRRAYLAGPEPGGGAGTGVTQDTSPPDAYGSGA